MLPLTLITLLQAILGANAQQSPTQLSLNSLYNFSVFTLPNPPLFSLPSAGSSNVSISVGLCASPGSSSPRFFLTNDPTNTQPGPGQSNTYELVVGEEGYGNWTGPFPNGGFLSASNVGQTPLEIGVSDEGSMHQLWDDSPLMGDTTSNQALIFSPAFDPVDIPEPKFPNYTLQVANTPFPVGPSNPPNITLFYTPTASSVLSSLPRTACALRAATGANAFNKGATDSNGLWLRDESGWRWQWMLGGLTPLTNYTFVALNGSQVSNPIYVTTKSGSFSCPIVHSLPYCPSVNYAVPIAAPPAPAPAHDSSTLNSNVTDLFFQVLTNFTTSLSTQACGRDLYSQLVTCSDCQQAYRSWLCAVWFPRCSEATAGTASRRDVAGNTQTPLSALLPQPSSATSRSPGLPPFSSYDELLPCLETCQAAERACPYFLGFKCPKPQFPANMSYGVGFIDSVKGGRAGGGTTGTSQDIWGNVWCNAG